MNTSYAHSGKRSGTFLNTCVIMWMLMRMGASWDFDVKTLLDHVHTIHESLKQNKTTNCCPNAREGHTDKCRRVKMFDDNDDAKKGFNLTDQSSYR